MIDCILFIKDAGSVTKISARYACSRPPYCADNSTSLLLDNNMETCESLFSDNSLQYITLLQPDMNDRNYILVDIYGSGFDCSKTISGQVSMYVTNGCEQQSGSGWQSMCKVVVTPHDRCIFECHCRGLCDKWMIQFKRPRQSTLQQNVTVCEIIIN